MNPLLDGGRPCKFSGRNRLVRECTLQDAIKGAAFHQGSRSLAWIVIHCCEKLDATRAQVVKDRLRGRCGHEKI